MTTGTGTPVVLETFAAPGAHTNPYLVQLLGSLRERTTVMTFSWRDALLARYDVLHVHLPDGLLRSESAVRTWVLRVLYLALLLRCRVRQVAIVRTLHNSRPHEGRGTIERWLLALTDRWTDWWIRINDVDAVPAASSTILHGHYRDWFAGRDDVPVQVGTLGYFGLVRPYKNVDRLLSAFGDLDGDVRLVVAGKPQDPDLEARLRDLASRDPRVRLMLSYLDDDELAETVAACELLVLPYRELQNSGAAILALSLDRPVLLPEGPTTRSLAAEVGEAWVQLYQGELDARALQHALTRVRSTDRSEGPDLEARSWAQAADAHLRAFDQAGSSRRRRGSR